MRRDLKLTDMVTITVYSNEYLIYCALIPSNKIKQVLSESSWDLPRGHGVPSTVEWHEDGKKRVEYVRYGDDDGIEPLVINRNFNESIDHGRREDYREISEEFRLFHRLYHDRKTDQYIKIDDEGNEHLVAVVEPDCIQIRLQEISQFLAIKEMYLSIQFSFRGNFRSTRWKSSGLVKTKHSQSRKPQSMVIYVGGIGGTVSTATLGC